MKLTGGPTAGTGKVKRGERKKSRPKWISRREGGREGGRPTLVEITRCLKVARIAIGLFLIGGGNYFQLFFTPSEGHISSFLGVL